MNLHRIASLEANGLNATQIGSIVNLSISRISQVQKTDEYQELLVIAKIETEEVDAETKAIDAKYLSAEHLMIDKVMELAPQADMREAILALKTISERKVGSHKQNIMHNGQQANLTQNITLILPPHIVEQHKPVIDITPSKEIVAINGRNLSPLNSGEVTKMFKEMQNVNTTKIEDNTHDRPTKESGGSTKTLPKVTEREDSFMSTSQSM